MITWHNQGWNGKQGKKECAVRTDTQYLVDIFVEEYIVYFKLFNIMFHVKHINTRYGVYIMLNSLHGKR